MSKSSGGIGLIPLMIVAFAVYNLFIDDDNDETSIKEDIKIKVEDVTEDIDVPAVKEHLKEALNDAKKALEEVKESFEKKKDVETKPGPGPLVTSKEEEPKEEIEEAEEKIEPEKQDEEEKEPKGRTL